MRALVIGFPLPNPQIDNYNLLTAPSWFDYDGVVVEPLSVSQVIEDVLQAREEHHTRADEPVLNRPTNPLAVGLAEVVRRRRVEVAHLLSNGGVVVVFAQPQVVHEGVVGFPGCDRYAFLPAPAGVSYDAPFLMRAEGTEVQPVDSTHPFARLIDANRRWINYRARFDDSVPGFSQFGHVFARSTGGAAVGLELKVGGGRVIFLPAFGSIAFGDQRFELATAVLDSLRLCLNAAASEEPPTWVSGVALPGAEELETEAREAAAAVAAAETRHAEAQAALADIVKYRALLWREGALALDPMVRQAFKAIGFEVESDPDKPGWIADGARRAFFEVEGSAETVLEFPYFRLQKRLEKDLLATREPKHGLLIVNGQRLLPPAERSDQVSETLRIAAENYRYGLLKTAVLFDMVGTVLERPLDHVLGSMLRTRLLETRGEIGVDLIPTAEETA